MLKFSESVLCFVRSSTSTGRKVPSPTCKVNGVTSTPPSTGGYVNYAAAVAYCNGLTISNKVWRLPTFSELTSLNSSLVSAGYNNIQPPGWPPLSQTWSSTSNGSGGYRTIYMPYASASLTDSRVPTDLAVTLCVTDQ